MQRQIPAIGGRIAQRLDGLSILYAGDSAKCIGVSKPTLYALHRPGALVGMCYGTRSRLHWARVDLGGFINRQRTRAVPAYQIKENGPVVGPHPSIKTVTVVELVPDNGWADGYESEIRDLWPDDSLAVAAAK